VLGTGVATRRIRSGQRIQVDGDAGTVTLLDGTDDAERPSPEPPSQTGTSSNARTHLLLALAAGAAIGVVAWWKSKRRG
jgi:pyruvate,water dikinase